MKIAWAWVRCWWYCLLHSFSGACMASTYLQCGDEARELTTIAAVQSDWSLIRVFYESTPGAGARTVNDMHNLRRELHSTGHSEKT